MAELESSKQNEQFESPQRDFGKNLNNLMNMNISPTEEEQFKKGMDKLAESKDHDDGDDTKDYLQLFQTYDRTQTGRIKLKDVAEIIHILGKEVNSVEDLITKALNELLEEVDFNQFLQVMGVLDGHMGPPKLQNESALNISQIKPQKIIIAPDPKVVEFLKMLNEYQKKSEVEGNYAEAKKSKAKMEEIKIKEIQRQQNNIKYLQEEELISVENAQKAQFLDFTTAWDNYMADYEATAYMSLEKLKEKHMNEIREFQDKLRGELSKSYKPSKQLIEIRQKQVALGKMKKYGEAEKVQAQGDALENWERGHKDSGVEDIIEKKTLALRKQQQLALNVLLKRIQKDRNQQLKNRQNDSQKLILRNRNIRAELLQKHAQEAKKAVESIKNNLSLLQTCKTGPGLDSDTSPMGMNATKKDENSFMKS